MNHMEAVSTKSIRINNSAAKEILQKEGSYALQRKIDPNYVKSYVKKMLNGKFRLNTPIAMALNIETKKYFVVNGYHRLYALSSISDNSFTLLVSIEKYYCKDDSEVEELYESFEEKPRTITDHIAVQASKTGMGNVHRPTLSWIMRYEKSMKKMSFHNSGGRLLLAENSKLILGKNKVVQFIEDVRTSLLNKKDNQPFKNNFAAFCMAHSFESYGEDVAMMFWRDVLNLSDVRDDGTVIEYNNPARTFRRMISNAYLAKPNSWWSHNNYKMKRIALLYQSAIRNWAAGNTVSKIPVDMESEFEWDGSTVKKLLAKKVAPPEKKRLTAVKCISATETAMAAN